jgi:hypothetical protein
VSSPHEDGPARPLNPEQDWGSPGKRVGWLLEHKFAGNRSAMARRLGFSHSTLSRVVAGDKPPGRRLMTEIVGRLGVNSRWLLTGEGEPFAAARAEAGPAAATPVARWPLPGSPYDHAEWLRPGSFDVTSLFGPGQYWYQLTSRSPVVRDRAQGFRAGDMLLFESDRRRFPDERDLHDRLCVVLTRADHGPEARLGLVSFREEGGPPGGLEVDLLEAEPAGRESVEEYVIRKYPDGSLRAYSRLLNVGGLHDGTRASEPGGGDQGSVLPQIAYEQVVGVWTEVLYRSRATSLD